MTPRRPRKAVGRKTASPVEAAAAPDVSVIVPVFNREALLADCLSSVRRQTLKAWECIVVDDGSSDASLEIAQNFAAADPRFRAFARTAARKGASACRNEALRQARGRYVMFLDSDDLLTETCLASRVAAFEGQPDRAFLVFRTGAYFERLHDRRALHNVDKDEPDLLRFFRLDNPWPINGPIWNRERLLEIGGFDERLPSWQDWQLHVTALLADAPYGRASGEPDSFIRIKGDDRIGMGAWAQRHVEPKAAFLLDLAERRRARLVPDVRLRSAVAGLAWHLLVRLEELGLRKDALAYWAKLRRLGYVRASVWLEGVLALLFHGRPGGSLWWSLVRRWPRSQVGAIDTSTMMSVPY